MQIAEDLVESCNALCLEVNRLNESEKIQEITKLEKQLQDAKEIKFKLKSAKESQANFEAQVAKLEEQLEEARRTEDVQLQAKLDKDIREGQEHVKKIAELEEQLERAKESQLENQLKEAQKCEEFAKLKELNSKTIIDLLDEATLNRMIDKIRGDKGRVKFETNWLGISAVKVAMHTPRFTNEKIIAFVKSFFPELIQQGLGSFALTSCASNCNILGLTASVKQLITEINAITTSYDKPINVFEKINETFESKGKSAGGRKQKSRRGRKHRGHKQKSRRGHKTRRHKRRSTRKH
jgi:Fe2+ transport system protein B